MYSPTEFRGDRVEAIHEPIVHAGFAVLVTVEPEGPEASHIPMVFDPEPAPGVHYARDRRPRLAAPA